VIHVFKTIFFCGHAILLNWGFEVKCRLDIRVVHSSVSLFVFHFFFKSKNDIKNKSKWLKNKMKLKHLKNTSKRCFSETFCFHLFSYLIFY
jgi:hypothetical protein